MADVSAAEANATASDANATLIETGREASADIPIKMESKGEEQEEEQKPPVLHDLPFRFLDLPPELRNEVYSYAMPGSNDIRSRDLATLQFPAITRASKQLRQESLGFLFSECHFVICIGTNYHHRSYVTSAYAKKPCRWDPVLDCGSLGFRPAVRKFLKTAGKAALFQDVTFNVYHPKDVPMARYKGDEKVLLSGATEWVAVKEQKMKGSLHLKVRERRLEVVVELTRFVGISWEFVEAAMKDAKIAAEEIGQRKDFRGLRMSDLHRIAKAFYWRPEE